MSKQAAALKTASQVPTPLAGRPKSRAAKAAEAQRLAAERFWAAYREWHETADSLPKRRAYIRRMCRRIAEEFKPEKIILFGSYAYGKPTMESDVDLLVVMEFEGGQFHQAHKITQRLSLALPLDLLVYTPERLQYRLEIGDRFIREIVEQGKVMYEATHA
jgi:predicted nucleotidyltransferase